MTLLRKTFYLCASLLLAGAMSIAQNQGSTPGASGSPQDEDSSMRGQMAGAHLRGCLSGSSGNYTLTDHNGSIYHLVGAGSDLRGLAGHEVEITGAPDVRRSGVSDSSAANTASSFQVAGVRDIARTCNHSGSAAAGA